MAEIWSSNPIVPHTGGTFNFPTATTEVVYTINYTDNNGCTATTTYTVTDPYAGHEYVEIGGLKWATMNIGATEITDKGLYFQWGDTEGYTADQVGSGAGQKYFGWEDYKYGNGTSSPGATGMTKYNSTDGKTVLDLSDDAARANWGGLWRMPTADEYVALGEAVNTAWTTDYQGSGVEGIICTDKIDSSKVLFFPVCSSCSEGEISRLHEDICHYWSSSLYSDVLLAYRFHAESYRIFWNLRFERSRGVAVRGVVG